MLRPGQAIILCVLALLALGVVMVNSADMTLAAEGSVTLKSIVFSRSSVYMALALTAMGVSAFLPVRRVAELLVGTPASLEESHGLIRRLMGPPIMWVVVVGMLGVIATVYLPFLGHEVNGSRRWLEVRAPGVGAVSLQPSEIIKWGMVVLMAWYGAKQATRMNRFWTGLIPALGAAGVLAAAIVLEDLGTGVLIGAVACVVLLAAGARWWHLALLTPAGAGMLVLAVASSEYRMKRLTSFLDPYADPEKTGFHMIQSMTAVANGEATGRGLGFGLQKFGYLPEDRTDFLFAVICEELGIAGAALVMFLYMGLVWAGVLVIKREKNPMLKLVALGVLSTVGIQALINLAVVTGLGPTKGIALPLLSSGGTGWILTAASLGLVVAIDRSQAIREWEEGDESSSETPPAVTVTDAPGPSTESLFAEPVA